MAPAVRSLLGLGLGLALPIGHAMRTTVEVEVRWEKFALKWDDYAARVEREAPHGLQPVCKPRRVRHHGGYKSVAVLFHGYSGCPDQWEQMARLLAEAGYEVLLPMNPGHGNALPAVTGIEVHGKCSKVFGKMFPCLLPLDDNTNVPVRAEEWRAFAEEINRIVRLAPAQTPGGRRVLAGEAVHVVGGISVGAVLAAYAGREAFEEGGAKPLYARQLIMNAFFAAHGVDAQSALADGFFAPYGFGRTESRNQWLSWGQNCFDERKYGRAGFCSMQVKNLETVGDFGKTTLENLQVSGKGQNAPKIAVIYSRGDTVVENSRMRDLTKKYSEQDADVSSCVLPFTSHSMLGDHDFKALGENRWWTTPVTCKAVRFLTSGVPVEISKETERSEGGDKLCELGCSGATCPTHVFKSEEEPTIPKLTCEGY